MILFHPDPLFPEGAYDGFLSIFLSPIGVFHHKLPWMTKKNMVDIERIPQGATGISCCREKNRAR
jgi:hypothetical protein